MSKDTHYDMLTHVEQVAAELAGFLARTDAGSLLEMFQRIFTICGGTTVTVEGESIFVNAPAFEDTPLEGYLVETAWQLDMSEVGFDPYLVAKTIYFRLVTECSTLYTLHEELAEGKGADRDKIRKLLTERGSDLSDEDTRFPNPHVKFVAMMPAETLSVQKLMRIAKKFASADLLAPEMRTSHPHVDPSKEEIDAFERLAEFDRHQHIALRALEDMVAAAQDGASHAPLGVVWSGPFSDARVTAVSPRSEARVAVSSHPALRVSGTPTELVELVEGIIAFTVMAPSPTQLDKAFGSDVARLVRRFRRLGFNAEITWPDHQVEE